MENKTITNDQIERLLNDIQSMKEVISRNRSLLSQIFNLAPFRWFMLCVGLSTIGFSSLIFSLAQLYGRFGAIPVTLRTIIYIAIAVCLVFFRYGKEKPIPTVPNKSTKTFPLPGPLKSSIQATSLICMSHLSLL